MRLLDAFAAQLSPSLCPEMDLLEAVSECVLSRKKEFRGILSLEMSCQREFRRHPVLLHIFIFIFILAVARKGVPETDLTSCLVALFSPSQSFSSIREMLTICMCLQT